jgi:Xaa-Pro aminopeptidase
MRYAPIDNQLFVRNRQRLAGLLKPKSMAIFNANDMMPTNADGTMGFRQNNDLFYLTGVDQEETVFLLFPDHPDEKFREVLFLRETSETRFIGLVSSIGFSGRWSMRPSASI